MSNKRFHCVLFSPYIKLCKPQTKYNFLFVNKFARKQRSGTYRVVVDRCPADGDGWETWRLWTRCLDVAGYSGVTGARTVDVQSWAGSGRVGRCESAPRRARVWAGWRAETLRRGRCCRLIVVHHCNNRLQQND